MHTYIHTYMAPEDGASMYGVCPLGMLMGLLRSLYGPLSRGHLNSASSALLLAYLVSLSARSLSFWRHQRMCSLGGLRSLELVQLEPGRHSSSSQASGSGRLASASGHAHSTPLS